MDIQTMSRRIIGMVWRAVPGNTASAHRPDTPDEITRLRIYQNIIDLSSKTRNRWRIVAHVQDGIPFAPVKDLYRKQLGSPVAIFSTAALVL